MTILVVKFLLTETLQYAFFVEGDLEMCMLSNIGQHLGKIIKEGISISFAEVHLSQGEEAGLLLDDVTENFTVFL